VGTVPSSRTRTGRSGPIRILLVDDQPLFRRAIATLLGEQPEFTVVGEAADGLEAIEKAHALAPDLIVMDVEMPVMNGVEAVRILRDQLPSIKIVVLTVSESEDYLLDAIRFGAHGYLLKDLRPEQLYELLRAVMRDETPLSPAIAGRLLQEVRRLGVGVERASVSSPGAAGRAGSFEAKPAMPDLRSILTRRELETLQFVADGLSNKEIGTRLSITEGTVKNHVHNALEKLQLENRIQATAYVIREGLAHRPEGG
jgi:DNA-binding NarL/FixJ family response regulator